MRILIFGPNGSGKGTQSARLLKHYGLAHVESGGIFRENIKGGTPLGIEAKAFIDLGRLVPDSITIPMVLDRLAREKERGWVLDGFPRNRSQAQALIQGLAEDGTPLQAVIIIELARETAKARLMGRRSCPEGHPNNTAIPAIQPLGESQQLTCWKCGSPLSCRADDVDENAIDQRLDIYFEETLGSIAEVESWASKEDVPVIRINGEGDIQAISQKLITQLG